MILSDHFVWLHVPKTGGTWVRETLAAHAPTNWNVRAIYPKHHGPERIPSELLDKPRFAFIRNPWDWHVSLFSFWLQHYQDRTGGFLENPWPAEAQHWADALEQSRDPDTHRWFRQSFSYRLHNDTLSYWLAEVTDEKTELLRFEDLRNEVIRWLDEHVPGGVPDSLRDRLLDAPPLMTSRHAPFRDYYDQATARRVEILEAYAVSKFGYEL